jgi:hypothetical protein
MSQPGTVKNTIYVNGVVKATQTLTTSPGANGFHGVGGVVMYIIP